MKDDLENKKKERTLRMETYNVITERRNRLEMIARAMEDLKVDIGIITEKTLTKGIHTKRSVGYDIFATDASNAFKGGVTLIYKSKLDYWHIESPRTHGPNVISCVITSGYKKWLLIVAYISPKETDEDTILQIESASKRYRYPVIICGDFNARIDSEKERGIKIMATIASTGASNLADHFFPKRKFMHKNTWMSHNRKLSSNCDYFFTSDRKIWKNLRYVEPRLFSSDHALLMGILIVRSKSQYGRYVRRRQVLPFVPSETTSEADEIFADLMKNTTKKGKREIGGKLSWISPITWRHIDHKTNLCKNRLMHKKEIISLNRKIRRRLKIYRRKRAEDVALEMEEKLEKNDVQGAWSRFKGWYKSASGTPPKPTHDDINRTSK